MKPRTRILVVDDEPAIRSVFTEILESAGFYVQAVATGAAGRQANQEFGPDIILLDVRLPDADGVALCREWKEEQKRPDQFIILCSGEARTGADKVAGLESGADDYLIKPVSGPELLARVRNAARLTEATSALRASEQQCRRLVEVLPDAVFRLDRQGRLVTANRQALSLLGEAAPEALMGRNFTELLGGEARTRSLAETLRPPDAATPSRECQLQTKAGGKVLVELSVAQSHDDARGNPIEYIVVARDVTLRHQAERRRAAFSRLGKQLSEADTAKAAAQIIVDIADELLGWDSCHVRLVNAAQDRIQPLLAYDLLEDRRAEVPVDELVSELTPVTREVLQNGALLIDDDSPLRESLTPFGNGRRRSAARLFATLRRGPKAFGIVSIQSYRARAYTPADLELLQALADHCSGALERISMAEALRESEGRFRSLFEFAPIGMALHDARGHYLNINTAYQEMLGYTEAELRERGIKGVTEPEDIPEGRQLFGELKSGQRDFYRRMKRYQTRAGRTVWAESSASAVRDARGELQFVVSMVADVTERRRAEAEIRQWNETLEQRVQERTTELEAANAALRESEQQLRLTLESANAGTWAWEANSRTMVWDQRSRALYGYSHDEAITYEAWLSRIHPADKHALLTRIREMEQTTEVVWNEEFRIVHPERGERWVAGIGQVIRDEAGQLQRMVGINLDITPRKTVETAVRRLNDSLEHEVRERTANLQASNAALMESEMRFRQLAENIQEVFWIRDLQSGKIIYISPAYEIIWGRPCASLYENGQSWHETIHPEDRARVREAATTKQVSGEYDEQYRIQRPDGSLRWIRARAYPIQDGAGRIYRVAGVAEDITRRKQIEAALQQSETRKTAIMESALDAIITLNKSGRILESNRAAENMFGHNRARLQQQSFDVLISPSLRAWFEQGRELGFTGEVGPHLGSPVELTAVRSGGEPFPAELSLARITTQGEPLFTAFIRDITAQRRAADQIRLLADALQSTHEVVSITDPENRFTYVNQAFLQTYGYQAKEILGKTPEVLFAPGVAGVCEEIYQKTLAGGWQGEIVQRHRDGREIPIALSTSLIKSATGQVVGLIGVARDISERKQAEKQSMAFGLLGLRLSGATTPTSAAEAIVEVATVLFAWDACYVHLLRPTDELVSPILMMDTLDGRKQRVAPSRAVLTPSPIMRSVFKDGARLVNRSAPEMQKPEFIRFGNVQKPSASLMYVPIHSGDIRVGILSLQSYTPNAYTERDLQLLQILADHCGDALRRVEVTEALRQTEMKYRNIVENATEGIFQTTPEGRYLTANTAQARILGYDSPEELIAQVTDIEHQTYANPEQREELKRLLESQDRIQGYEVERVRKDGRHIWTSINGHVVREATGKTSYYECTSQDITQRKLAEFELRRMSHLIIEAQESERQRVARELHDGVNQLLASVKMRLSKLNEKAPDLGPATREILSRCEQLMVQALEENRRIAHNLRPTDLDHLGLVETCRNFCRELATQSHVDVKFRAAGWKTRLPANLELNLFRILQEATNNIQKHARAQTIRITLTLTKKNVRLKIQDDGRGFDPGKLQTGKNRRHGAGLANMRERASALGGTCECSSAPKQGTCISIRVPLS